MVGESLLTHFWMCMFFIMTLLVGCTAPQEKVYMIRDECGPIQGTVFHSIQDSAMCRIRCRGHCESLDYEFVASEFVDKGNRCHECNCTCRIS